MNAFVARQERSHLGLGLAVAALVIVLDQVTKWWILSIMQPPHVIEVLPFFNLVLVWNQGVSFGLFSHEAEIMPYVLSAVALGIAGVLLSWLRRADRWFVALALGMVIGGAIGNIIDRLRFGAVVDFLDVHAMGWHFWVFNIADSGISVGVALLVIDGLFATPEKS
ncbi:MAG TPA: signal peptidase II [Azospirillum sp.]|nr:signal peptidase II [Azospirillum sp.]